MIFESLLSPFLENRPVAVMIRACLECAFADSQIDDLFARVATTQYYRQLTFSSMVDLVAKVVTRRYSSIHAAYRAEPTRLAASLNSIYEKLQCTELALSETLVHHSAQQLGAVVQGWKPHPQPFPGLKLKIVDGNYLAGTDHRLQPTRNRGAAALPGMAVVVQDHGTGLITNVCLQSDAYTNERALFTRLLPLFKADEIVVGDRNFCVEHFLAELTHQNSYFVIRHHAGTALNHPSEEHFCGKGPTGDVYEQSAQIGSQTYRVIRIELTQPTQQGETDIRVLTNLPANRATALDVAQSYRMRWTIEATFLELTRSVTGELPGLGHPKAALFAFSLALCACNALRVAERAFELSQSEAHPGEEVSSYFMMNELIAAYDGMEVTIPEKVWGELCWIGPQELGAWLLKIAGMATWSKYRKSKRKETDPKAKKVGERGSPHFSTQRALEDDQGRRKIQRKAKKERRRFRTLEHALRVREAKTA